MTPAILYMTSAAYWEVWEALRLDSNRGWIPDSNRFSLQVREFGVVNTVFKNSRYHLTFESRDHMLAFQMRFM